MQLFTSSSDSPKTERAFNLAFQFFLLTYVCIKLYYFYKLVKLFFFLSQNLIILENKLVGPCRNDLLNSENRKKEQQKFS